MALGHVTLPRASRSMYHEWNEKDKLDVSLENLIFNSAFPKARARITPAEQIEEFWVVISFYNRISRTNIKSSFAHVSAY